MTLLSLLPQLSLTVILNVYVVSDFNVEDGMKEVSYSILVIKSSRVSSELEEVTDQAKVAMEVLERSVVFTSKVSQV